MSVMCALLLSFTLFVDDAPPSAAARPCLACRAATPAACCADQGCACLNGASAASQPGVELRMMMVKLPAERGDDDEWVTTQPPHTAIVHDDAHLRARLHELAQEQRAKIICEPVLSVRSGGTASINIGGEFPIIVSQPKGPITVEFREYGIRVECTPTVLGDDTIQLKLRPELSELDYVNGVVMNGFTIPAIRQSRIETTVSVHPGETALLSGMVSHTSAAASLMVPCFVELPCFGHVSFPVCSPIQISQPIERHVILLAKADLADPLFRQASSGAVTGDVVTAEHITCRDIRLDVNEAQTGRVLFGLGVHSDAGLLEKADVDEVRGLIELVHRLDGDLIVDAEEGDVVIRLPLDSCPDVLQTVYELDADQPHPILSPRLEVAPFPDLCPDSGGCGYRAVLEGDTASLFFGAGADAELAPSAGCRRDGCCRQAAADDDAPACCRKNAQDDSEDGDDDESSGDDSDDLVEQMFQMQLDYVKQSFLARLEYEREILKSHADVAIARQEIEHVHELMDLRLAHQTDLERAHRATWESQRQALEAQHERDLAGLREEHVKEMYEVRVAAMEKEIQSLHDQTARNEVAKTDSHPTSIDSQSQDDTDVLWVREPLRVEDLTSGRVRYPEPAGEGATADEEVEPVQFTVRAHERQGPMEGEVERLRRDLARLRALVEDLLCTAPDSPPTPVPQHLPE